MDQTQREFLIEIEELVERLFVDLDRLRTSAAGESSPRKVRESIDQIFRTVHTIKGSAGTSGLETVGGLAHEFENALHALRTGKIKLDAGLLNTFVATAEALGESVRSTASDTTAPSNSALIDQLRAAATEVDAGPNRPATTIIEKLESELWRSLNDTEKHRLRSAVDEGSQLFTVETAFDLADFDQRFQKFKDKLSAHGEIVSTSPSVDDRQPDKINFRILYASDLRLEKLEASVAEFPDAEFTPIPDGSAKNCEPVSNTVSTSAPYSRLASFVRTDLEKLDRLISSTDELFRSSSRALDLALSQDVNAAERQEQLRALNDQIRKQFLGVEHELINLRLVSLDPTLQRAARAGRAAARLVGKEIDFDISGGELRVDKLIADAIADPLIHLVRNAVDHGIEDAAARDAAGKKGRGRISIRAISEGSQSRVRVMDDGRGIDPLEIAGAAKRLGLTAVVPPDSERIDIDRSLRLIFRPGFTTLDKASEISGRGVGLDVVETAIEQVGGELRVSTEPARGTTFEIRLPVTFGIIAANVVVSAGIRYCIPADQTLGIDAIDLVDGASGANQLRQVSMRDLLGQPDDDEDAGNQMHLITCQFTDERAGHEPESKCLGIVVDRVEGPQEVLVRSLGRHAGRWYGIAGATALKDGTLALVLDLPRLLIRAK
ncbi:MAG TPA: ATP-binding protein [Pyrinomonadaceae bacterium]|nr:ATP-binding protein [Pyrinomonadaceae bacterium]